MNPTYPDMHMRDDSRATSVQRLRSEEVYMEALNNITNVGDHSDLPLEFPTLGMLKRMGLSTQRVH
jgi:hypothetical protein